MPRLSRNTPGPKAAVIPTPSLVASAVKYPGQMARIYLPTRDWQREAYRQFEICGEARFAATFMGHALSRVTLHAAKKTSKGVEREKASRQAQGLLDELFNGKQGQEQMLRALGIHLTIAGECYLVGRNVNGADTWEVVSVMEMNYAGGTWTIDYGGDPDDGDMVQPITLSESDVVIRIWQPHPAKRMEADSPFRSLLPVLTEIEWATKHIFSQISSRLAGAGILFLSQGLSFPNPPETEGDNEVASEADVFMKILAEAMMKSLAEPGHPSARVPITVAVPPELLREGKVAELLHFWSDLDGKVVEMRKDAIIRFADGMDLPREQVMGMSSNSGTGGGSSNGVSHWGAWQVEEQTIKMHVEPMVSLVCNSLVIAYLRPLTSDLTDRIVGDTSALRLRPDRSQEAFELYDRGLISLKALMREVGFDPDDAMDEHEFKFWLLRKVAGGSATPEQVEAALTELGVVLNTPEVQSEPREARPDPSLEDHPQKPRDPSERTAAILPAANVLVIRALERAGNRMRQKFKVQVPNVKAYEMHTVYQVNGEADFALTDAWSVAPIALDGIENVDQVVEALNAYCKVLLAEQAPHTRDRLATFLEKTCA